MTDQSEHSAESTPPDNLTIDATELFNAALKADSEGGWGNDGAFDADALKIAEGAKDVPSGNRAPDASGEAETKQDKAEPSAEPQEHTGHPKGPQRDPVTGKFLPKDQKVSLKQQVSLDSEKAESSETKPETPYAKAKEAERQKSVLANFEKEKAEARAQIEAERRQLAAEKAEIRRFKQVPRTKDGSPHEFNSRQYAKAADDFYGRAKKALAEGDIEQSNQLLAQAEQCSQAAEQVAKFEATSAQEQQAQQYWSTWEKNMDHVLTQEPELRDVENNPVAKEIKTLLEDKDWGPILERIPNGFGVAAQLMKWKVQAVEASALSEKLKKAEAERDEARARIGIRPAPTSGGMPQPTTFENLSDAEKRRALMQEAFESDRVPSFG